MEVEVRPPRFVDEQRNVVLVRDRGDARDIGGDAVVRRAHDVDGLDVGMRFERLRARVCGVTV